MSGSSTAKLSTSSPDLGSTLPGFEGIRRYWDKKYRVTTARVLPGEYYVSGAEEMIQTVLGSCVSACIRDAKIGIGGMNHFMLPDVGDGPVCVSGASRYGSFAMEHMINDILSHGGRRERLEIKLFGGGRMNPSATDIGARNAVFVQDYLAREQLSIAAQDLGGEHPRKILYYPRTGKVLMKKMPLTAQSKIAKDEDEYKNTIDSKPFAGEIDLF